MKNQKRDPELCRLWRDHMACEFPARLRGEEVAGVDMVMLDADIAGCVSTWAHSRSDLDDARVHVLRRCERDLERVLPELADDREAEYYTRLRSMTQIVLAAQARSA